MKGELTMTLINLRKWLPIYKAAKNQIDIDKRCAIAGLKHTTILIDFFGELLRALFISHGMKVVSMIIK